jgi:hypothetical protein
MRTLPTLPESAILEGTSTLEFRFGVRASLRRNWGCSGSRAHLRSLLGRLPDHTASGRFGYSFLAATRMNVGAGAAKNHPYVHFSSVTFFVEATRTEETLDAEHTFGSYLANLRGSGDQIRPKMI